MVHSWHCTGIYLVSMPGVNVYIYLYNARSECLYIPVQCQEWTNYIYLYNARSEPNIYLYNARSEPNIHLYNARSECLYIYICSWGFYLSLFLQRFILDFGIFLTVWYCMFSILLKRIKYCIYYKFFPLYLRYFRLGFLKIYLS
jgi:hypothetical protein